MGNFESKRIYNPELTQENRLPPRATSVPALHRGVFYKNRGESELILDLNGTYKFCYRSADDLEGFFAPDYDDFGWKDLAVPSMWQYHGYSKPLYPNIEYPIPFVPPFVGNQNPVGYYRKRFSARKGGRRILYFGGVDSAFFVYLNGEYVGFSKGSRIPAEFDVTALLKDGENLLCVKVFTYSDGTYLENQDMLLASGIFRDVFLYTLGDAHLWDYCIRTQKDTVYVDLSLAGEWSAVTALVSVAGQVQSVQNQKEAALQFELDAPQRWNAEEPHTYELCIELYKGDVLLEMHTKKFGFAEFSIDGNRLLLNGRQITLKGINRHEHDPQNGRAISVERIEKELRMIKDHNMNAIRCAHYPNHPAFYELCTELGLYVMNEADIETHGSYVCGDMGYFAKQPRWYGAFYDRVQRMYERDKNETCISIWSLGNENGDGENLHRCFEYLKSRSVQKPVMHTGDNGTEPRISEFRAFGYHTMAQLQSFPPKGKPVMMLEYGHAMGNSPGLMQDTWDYVYRHRHICGGYVWEFKNHGFYQQDEEGNTFYQYGGDFGDLNHWSNFSMDGYCTSDGTPKPSFADCKNVLAPTYVYRDGERIMVMNTNDFRPLDDVTLHWSIAEDYQPIKTGQLHLPAIKPYESAALEIDSSIENAVAGAEYFLNLRFYDPQGRELAYKQVSLGIPKPKERWLAAGEPMQIEKQGNTIALQGSDFQLRFKGGMLCYLKKGAQVLLDAPMALNLYRAPTDNDGVVNRAERWIAKWNERFYRYFEVILLQSEMEPQPNGAFLLKFKGKWTPISKFVGFDLELWYTVTQGGNVLVEIQGVPYGKFAETLPRIGVVFPLDASLSDVEWYGRGEDECYVDRCAQCNFGLYQKRVDELNFRYDIPQECGTRIDTRFLKVGDFCVVGSDRFAFSCHDFTLDDLVAARHCNELKKADRNYLYIDYAMRGLGSKSCGPDPEECYELRPHAFRFAFLLAPGATRQELLALSRKHLGAVTEKRSETYVYNEKKQYENIVECDRE